MTPRRSAAIASPGSSASPANVVHVTGWSVRRAKLTGTGPSTVECTVPVSVPSSSSMTSPGTNPRSVREMSRTSRRHGERGPGVAVPPGALGGGELGLHAVARERDAVVADLGDLGRVVERRGVGRDRRGARRLDGGRVDVTAHRQQRHLAAVEHPGAHVRVAEAREQRVVDVVAAVVQRPLGGVGPEPDHPVRQHRAGVGEARRERPDHGVDEGGQRLRGARGRAGRDPGDQGSDEQRGEPAAHTSGIRRPALRSDPKRLRPPEPPPRPPGRARTGAPRAKRRGEDRSEEGGRLKGAAQALRSSAR